MIKGPLLNLRRPFAKHRIIFAPEQRKILVSNVGPFGGPRPFARINPTVDPERIAECAVSDAGTRFGAGSVSDGATTDITELPPEAAEEAISRAESWCEGLMESTKEESRDLDEEQIEGLIQDVERSIRAERESGPIEVEGELIDE